MPQPSGPAAFRLRHLDFNLLRVFLAVFEERSVARAAARLNVSASAISHSLGTLRQFFQDELFVRDGAAMRPTQLAMNIGPRVGQAMLQLEQAIVPSTFDPASDARRFVIILTPYCCRLILPPLMDRFHAEAPRSEIRVRQASSDLTEDFRVGGVHLGLVLREVEPAELASEPLFTDEWVWALPADHPVAHGKLTLERLVQVPHVVVTPRLDAREATVGDPAEWIMHHPPDEGALQRALSAAGLHQQVSVNVPDAATALAVASRSGRAVMSPRRLVQDLAALHGLKLFDPPYPAPTIQTRMVWRRDPEPDAAIEWLKALMRDAAERLASRRRS